jgi:hypothetical protein
MRGAYQFLRQKREASTNSIAPPLSLVSPTRPFAPLQFSSYQQTDLEQPERSNWSFQQISIYEPNSATIAENQTAPSFTSDTAHTHNLPLIASGKQVNQPSNGSFEHIAITRNDLPNTTHTSIVQKMSSPQDEVLQPKAATSVYQQENNTGLPDSLKAGAENLASLSLDDVHVHYNSSRPAAMQALAYAQGTEIHVGPGQEKHLSHEVWHVVQQKQGRVEPTSQARGVQINDNDLLEQEADIMGTRAISAVSTSQLLDWITSPTKQSTATQTQQNTSFQPIVQGVFLKDKKTDTTKTDPSPQLLDNYTLLELIHLLNGIHEEGTQKEKNAQWLGLINKIIGQKLADKDYGKIEPQMFAALPHADTAAVSQPQGKELGNMKSVKEASGASGQNYMVSQPNKTTDEKQLQNEVILLQILASFGLPVPNLYSSDQLPTDQQTGLPKIQNQPAFIADKINGPFIDVWKNSGSLVPALRTFFDKIDAHDRPARAKTCLQSLTRIHAFLQFYTIVDLQIAIDSATGQVFIIDPAAIYSGVPQKHQNDQKLVSKDVQEALLYLNSVIENKTEPLDKKVLESLYEKCKMDNDIFFQEVKKELKRRGLPDNVETLRSYLKLSQCLDDEEISELLK